MSMCVLTSKAVQMCVCVCLWHAADRPGRSCSPGLAAGGRKHMDSGAENMAAVPHDALTCCSAL